jgi:crotonobetainyl-CoA:carnitine CoA-transferase CaiB-like acyl-CoA transferase
VVFNNLRGDLPANLGVTYEQLKDVNPRIVCGHLSGIRPHRVARRLARLRLPDAGRGRLPVVTGEPDGPPARMGLSIIDLMTARPPRWACWPA